MLFAGRKHVRDIARSYGFNKFLSVACLHAQHPNMYPDIPPESIAPHYVMKENERIAACMVLMDPHNWERDLQVCVCVCVFCGKIPIRDLRFGKLRGL